jgi:hypothetical protein
MSMRVTLLLAILLLVAGPSVHAQKALGRSANGSLKATNSDSTGVAIPAARGSVAFDLEFSEASGNEYLEQKETGRLRIAISNTGSAAIKGVYVRLNPLQEVRGVAYPDSIQVGEIPANATRYAIFYFQAADRLEPQIVTFGVEVRGGAGLLADPKLLTFLTR